MPHRLPGCFRERSSPPCHPGMTTQAPKGYKYSLERDPPRLLGFTGVLRSEQEKRAETHLLLCSERLLCGQNDQQFLQGSPLNGLHLDLWVAVGEEQESMILHLLTNLGACPAQVRGLLPQWPSLVKNKEGFPLWTG